MSTRRYLNPPNLLAEALNRAKSQLAESAIERAEENLSGMADECRARIEGLLQQIDEVSSNAQDTEMSETLLRTYSLAVKVVGLGTTAGYPELDVAAKNLCDVLDSLIATGKPNPRLSTLVTVHTNTMRRLRDPANFGEGAAALLAGLQALRLQFATRPNADGSGKL